jgi:hypothetical protein
MGSSSQFVRYSWYVRITPAAKLVDAVVGDLFQPETPQQQLFDVVKHVHNLKRRRDRDKKPGKTAEAPRGDAWLTAQLALPLTPEVLLHVLQYYGNCKGSFGIQATVSLWGRLTSVPSLHRLVDARVVTAVLTTFASADRAPLRHAEHVFNYALSREAQAAILPQSRVLSPAAIIQMLIVYSKSQPAAADEALALLNKVRNGVFSGILPNHRMVDSVLVTLARATPPRIADAEALFDALASTTPSLSVPVSVHIVNSMLLGYASGHPPPVQVHILRCVPFLGFGSF